MKSTGNWKRDPRCLFLALKMKKGAPVGALTNAYRIVKRSVYISACKRRPPHMGSSRLTTRRSLLFASCPTSRPAQPER